MVQIIQSGPSQATLRQQAMDQAMENIVSGLGAYQKQEGDKAQTKRQQALDEIQMQAKLADAGYDVTRGQLAQALSPAPEQGLMDKLMGKEAPAQAPLDLFAKRTPEYLAKQESAKTKAERESQMFGAELGYKQAQAKDLESQSPLRAQKSQMELQKIQADLSMSPLARRKAEAEIKKLEAETTKAGKEATLGKAPTDAQMKAAGFAERARLAESELAQLPVDIGTGYSATLTGSGLYPEMMKSEEQKLYEQAKNNFITANLRLESGAAIGADEYKVEEKKYFPQPGDTPRVLEQKARARQQATANLASQAGERAGGLTSTAARQSAQSAPMGVDMNAINAALAKRGVAID